MTAHEARCEQYERYAKAYAERYGQTITPVCICLGDDDDAEVRPWTEVKIYGNRHTAKVEIATNDPNATGRPGKYVSRRSREYTATSASDDAIRQAYSRAQRVPDTHQLLVLHNGRDVTKEVIEGGA